MPYEVRDLLSLCAIGSIIELAMRVDMEKIRRNDIVRMLVEVLDIETIPSSVEIAVGGYVYDIFFKVEVAAMEVGDEDFERGEDHEGEDKLGKGKDVEMEDRDAKRLKNNSVLKSNASENCKGHYTSNTKGNTSGLLASNTIWVTPRVVRKELEMATRVEGVLFLNEHGQNSAETKDGLPTDQNGVLAAVSGDVSMADALLVVQQKPANPAILGADVAVQGNSAIEPAPSDNTPGTIAFSPDVSSVADSFLEAPEMPNAAETRPRRQDIASPDKGMGDVPSDRIDFIATKVASVPRLADPAVHRGVIEDSVFAKAAIVKSDGVFRKVMGHEVDTVEPRQSERIKKQQTGDEDSVKKAMRRAQVRNLELNPSKFGNRFSFLSFSNEQVVEKVASIGISLGDDSTKIASTIKSIKNLEFKIL